MDKITHDQISNESEEIQSNVSKESNDKMRLKLERAKLSNYKKSQKQWVILTTRFNNETWNINKDYRKTKEVQCVYCSPHMACKDIPPSSLLFVLEMNNDENKIKGIGLIRNKFVNYKHEVYDNMAYNRYNYVGHNYISRQDMDVEEQILMKYLDYTCFKGNRHLKRGQGLTRYPIMHLYKWKDKIDLVNYVRFMFKRRVESNMKKDKYKTKT